MLQRYRYNKCPEGKECSCGVTECRPAGKTERSAAKLDSKPSRDCLRLLDGDAMLRRRVLLLVRDTWRAVAGSLLVRRLLLRDSPRCALASRSAVSRRFIRDFRPCLQAAAEVCMQQEVTRQHSRLCMHLRQRAASVRVETSNLRADKAGGTIRHKGASSDHRYSHASAYHIIISSACMCDVMQTPHSYQTAVI